MSYIRTPALPSGTCGLYKRRRGMTAVLGLGLISVSNPSKRATQSFMELLLQHSQWVRLPAMFANRQKFKAISSSSAIISIANMLGSRSATKWCCSGRP